MQIEKAYLFARQISGQPPLPSKSYLFNNGVFNTEWVRDDFSLSNYVDVVGSKPAGDEDYMDYNARKYYWSNSKSYVDTGSCLYVRDTGSSICTLTQDNTFIIDTTQCPYEYTGVQNDTANMFCIRLREDHIKRYNSVHFVFRILEGNRTQSRYYKPQISFDEGYYESANDVKIYFMGGEVSDSVYPPFPSEWIDVGGNISYFESGELAAEYVRINTISLSKMEVKEIYFTNE